MSGGGGGGRGAGLWAGGRAGGAGRPVAGGRAGARWACGRRPVRRAGAPSLSPRPALPAPRAPRSREQPPSWRWPRSPPEPGNCCGGGGGTAGAGGPAPRQAAQPRGRRLPAAQRRASGRRAGGERRPGAGRPGPRGGGARWAGGPSAAGERGRSGAPGGGGSRRVVRWGRDLRLLAPRAVGARGGRGERWAPWERQVRASRDPGCCGKGAGDTQGRVWGGRTLMDSRLAPWHWGPRQGSPRSGSLNLGEDLGRVRGVPRAHWAGTRPLGPHSRPRRGPASEDQCVRAEIGRNPGAPCAPGRVPEPDWGPATGPGGSGLGGAGNHEAFQVRVPRSPPAAWSQWGGCRRLLGPNQY